MPLSTSAESLALFRAQAGKRSILCALGADSRGLANAIYELADRISADGTIIGAFSFPGAVVEQPETAVRSVMRQFTSELLDKPWLEDRDAWRRYLTMLASHRFNRLHLAFGLGYDMLNRVADPYMLFLYPFVATVPGYDVRVTGVSDAEREHNMETLRFIAEETVAHGLDFELGIWMHGYQYPAPADGKYVVRGITAENHASYCRDALADILRACPAISSVGLRIHGESGIAEGSYDFWGTVFDGVPRSGRTVEIDLHAKGIDATMIGRAVATKMPVNISPKYAAEHCGMPYHQASIRELEMPVAGKTGAGLMTLSEGSRVFTRYGYADLMRADRSYTVRTRVFSGTQRILAWNDPEWAAAYARSFTFAGMTGADLMEPLTCRGRRGTGAGRRDGYAGEALATHDDWQKYSGWYRAFGRTMYNPKTPSDVFQRELGADVRARSLASAVSTGSRVLAIVTSAHLPSAACDAYWPEIYWNHAIVGETPRNQYTDTPSPKNFQHVSPLDPQLFSSISEFADELMAATRSGKYTPVDVAQWLEALATSIDADLKRAGSQSSAGRRRIAIDAAIQSGLAKFFAAKFRAGVLYAIYEKTSSRPALEASLDQYRSARTAWSDLSDAAKVYQPDLSASDKISERGQWSDRLAGIDDDIMHMEQKLATAANVNDPLIPNAITEALTATPRTVIGASHSRPASPKPGMDLPIRLTSAAATSATLYYRHVNQAERYMSTEMVRKGNVYAATIPAAYTSSPFPLQYYFELRDTPARASLYPGFAPGLSNQPYFVIGGS